MNLMKIVMKIDHKLTINNKTLHVYLTFHESSEQKQTSLLTQPTLLI